MLDRLLGTLFLSVSTTMHCLCLTVVTSSNISTSRPTSSHWTCSRFWLIVPERIIFKIGQTNPALHGDAPQYLQCESKKSSLWFSDIFFQTVGNFTHLLYVTIYARLQIFIQLSPTLTKLGYTKWDHPSIFLHFTTTNLLSLFTE